MRRWMSNSVVLLGGVMLGGGAVALCSPSVRDGLAAFGKSARRWKAEEPVPAPAPGVVVRTLIATDVPDELVAWGRFVPDRQVQMAFRVGGALATRPVEVGSRVAAGDTLATINQEVAATALAEAQALLANAIADRTRLAKLADSSTLTDRERADTAVAVRRALLARAGDALAAHTIAAPFAGVVSAAGPRVGAQLAPGVPLCTIDQVDPIRLELPLPPHRVPSLRAGMTVRIAVDGMPGPPRVGTLSRIPPRARAADGLFVCEILVANPDGRLRAGYVARGTIERGRFEGVVALPRGAVEEDAHGVLRLAVLAGSAPADGSERQVESLALEQAIRLDARVLVPSRGLVGRLAVIAGPRPLPHGTTVRAFAEGSETEPRVAGSSDTGQGSGNRR